MAPWATMLVIQGSTGTLPGTPLGPDLDFIDFFGIWGPSWESLWRQFGQNSVILDVKIRVGIRNLFLKRFCVEMCPSWGSCMC